MSAFGGGRGGAGGGRVKKVMTQPISLIFRFLQNVSVSANAVASHQDVYYCCTNHLTIHKFICLDRMVSQELGGSNSATSSGRASATQTTWSIHAIPQHTRSLVIVVVIVVVVIVVAGTALCYRDVEDLRLVPT